MVLIECLQFSYHVIGLRNLNDAAVVGCFDLLVALVNRRCKCIFGLTLGSVNPKIFAIELGVTVFHGVATGGVVGTNVCLVLIAVQINYVGNSVTGIGIIVAFSALVVVAVVVIVVVIVVIVIVVFVASSKARNQHNYNQQQS